MGSFFEKNRKKLAARGIDLARVPPGQYVTERFPVLHAGVVPEVDIDEWDFVVDGLVDNPVTLSWVDISELPTEDVTTDIHCVTKWTKLDTEWAGIPVAHLWEMVQPRPEASHVVVNAYHGYTANLPVEDFIRPGNLFAHTYGGQPLELDHGFPLRLVVPHLYFWKSVKWVRGFTVVDSDQPGFWERNGYHMYGDPFEEQRYWGD
ncbi:MAG: sulfite oxidase-like oxidoreductase [Acidimicrobiia bacterium]|nr:sulfite oxidase-like oxidoreductase [Acidimicrobiia bacterium]